MNCSLIEDSRKVGKEQSEIPAEQIQQQPLTDESANSISDEDHLLDPKKIQEVHHNTSFSEVPQDEYLSRKISGHNVSASI